MDIEWRVRDKLNKKIPFQISSKHLEKTGLDEKKRKNRGTFD